jgi:Trk-type K+ transport system membrane component
MLWHAILLSSFLVFLGGLCCFLLQEDIVNKRGEKKTFLLEQGKEVFISSFLHFAWWLMLLFLVKKCLKIRSSSHKFYALCLMEL